MEIPIPLRPRSLYWYGALLQRPVEGWNRMADKRSTVKRSRGLVNAKVQSSAFVYIYHVNDSVSLAKNKNKQKSVLNCYDVKDCCHGNVYKERLRAEGVSWAVILADVFSREVVSPGVVALWRWSLCGGGPYTTSRRSCRAWKRGACLYIDVTCIVYYIV